MTLQQDRNLENLKRSRAYPVDKRKKRALKSCLTRAFHLFQTWQFIDQSEERNGVLIAKVQPYGPVIDLKAGHVMVPNRHAYSLPGAILLPPGALQPHNLKPILSLPIVSLMYPLELELLARATQSPKVCDWRDSSQRRGRLLAAQLATWPNPGRTTRARQEAAQLAIIKAMELIPTLTETYL